MSDKDKDIAKENRQFKVTDIQNDKGALQFVLSGSHEYGLDKSVANAIRRTLLSDIPTVAFEVDEGQQPKQQQQQQQQLGMDITMVTNDTALHNEMMMHRIGLIPLYLNPDTFYKNYFFECHVKHEGTQPFQFVTSNDMNIYPLKSHLAQRIDDLRDESVTDEDPHEEANLQEILETHSPDNYDLLKPLTQKEKDKILRPFEFRGSKNYCLLNELKNTNTEDTFQSLHFFGSPSVKTGKENARYQAVSQVSYSFLKDEPLIQQTLADKLKLDAVEKADEDEYTKKFLLGESERYFFRDAEGEPNRYLFKVKSCHYFDSGDLVKRSLDILMDECSEIKRSLLHLLQDKESPISVKQVEGSEGLTYHYTLNNQGHTMGSLIQSHIVRRCLKEKGLLTLCGYKQPHPLEDSIVLYVTLNPKHKITKEPELSKLQFLTSYLMDQMEEIRGELKEISSVLKKSV